jgi:hypothetical protein
MGVKWMSEGPDTTGRTGVECFPDVGSTPIVDRKFKIAIWFEDEQKFDLVPFVFFMSAVNTVQKTFEFYFPDPPDSLTYENAILLMLARKTIFADRSGFIPDYDVYIFITASHMEGNYFSVQHGSLAHITTFGWEEHFSPPSVFEYLFHSILCNTIYALTDVKHHRYSIMGCQFEYTRIKEYDRVDIALGHICQEHSEQISDQLGEKGLSDCKFLFGLSWLGKPDEYGSIFYKMKELFSYDLRKDSGYMKGFLERVQTNLDAFWFDIGKELFKAIVLICVTYIIVKFGLR